MKRSGSSMDTGNGSDMSRAEHAPDFMSSRITFDEVERFRQEQQQRYYELTANNAEVQRQSTLVAEQQNVARQQMEQIQARQDALKVPEIQASEAAKHLQLQQQQQIAAAAQQQVELSNAHAVLGQQRLIAAKNPQDAAEALNLQAANQAKAAEVEARRVALEAVQGTGVQVISPGLCTIQNAAERAQHATALLPQVHVPSLQEVVSLPPRVPHFVHQQLPDHHWDPSED